MKSPFPATISFPTALMSNTLTLCQPNYFRLTVYFIYSGESRTLFWPLSECFFYLCPVSFCVDSSRKNNDDMQLLLGSH
ncbi:Uncharacterized protein APZ42_023559 [Daphnia magna]|uniref:Uncharacterized protein n=1 Tax=Daphnia magna TaxID=35525 RepID=A0A164USY4_9CRUS|nr:Uncharacterized protein APZ42_023559 [Daphnia magna]